MERNNRMSKQMCEYCLRFFLLSFAKGINRIPKDQNPELLIYRHSQLSFTLISSKLDKINFYETYTGSNER